MNLINNYQKGFEDWLNFREETTKTKEQYICDEVFQIESYDDYLSEEIGKDISKIIKIISEKKNYEYINKGTEEYKTFILISNILLEHEMIDWGTSIRGCWLTSNGEKLKNFLDNDKN